MLFLYKYRLRCMLRNRSLLFWTLAFPLILTTLFNSVLRDVMHTIPVETMDIVVIENAAYREDSILQKVLKEAKMDDKAMFHVTIMDEAKAKQALDKEEISAYIRLDDKTQVYIKESNLSATIITSFFEEYEQQKAIITDMMKAGITTDKLRAVFADTQQFIEKSKTSNDELDAVFFYTVLAMNCLFGGYWTIASMHDIQADQSARAARLAIAPMKKATYLFVDFLLTITFEICFTILIFAYMYGLLGISFGDHMIFILLTLLIGSFAGNAIGSLIGIANIKKQTLKTGILTSITMLGSFLSGMMMVQIKYFVQLYVPWLNMINPVNMITDALYAIYYYGLGDRYYFNILSLCIVIVLGYGISFIKLRKKMYNSLEVR